MMLRVLVLTPMIGAALITLGCSIAWVAGALSSRQMHARSKLLKAARNDSRLPG